MLAVPTALAEEVRALVMARGHVVMVEAASTVVSAAAVD